MNPPFPSPHVKLKPTLVGLRGHVEIIFGKINVVKGGVACDANFFCLCIAFFLLTITPRFCCNYANYITRVILLRS